MKKLVMLLGLVLLAATVPVRHSYAQMGSMMDGYSDEIAESSDTGEHAESVDVVLREILSNHSVSTVDELDLDRVTDEEWERLGDAVMELYHPGEAHEAMDRMMGGEGSESLRQMHIHMGKAYLGQEDGYGPGMTPLRPSGYEGQVGKRFLNMKGGGFPMMGFGSMMGYGAGSVEGSILWISAVAFFLSGTYFFLRRGGKK